MKRTIARTLKNAGAYMFRNRHRPLFLPFESAFYRFYQRGYLNHNFDSRTNGEDRLLAKLLPILSPETIFDVGSNEGQWAVQVLEKWPQSKLHCFEPVPFSFDKLQRNLSRHPNIRLNKLGISKKHRSSTVTFSKADTTTATTVSPDLLARAHRNSVRFSEHVTCDFVSAASYVKTTDVSHINYLKIDVEGGDLEVLHSFLAAKIDIDVIQFEFTIFSRLNRVLLVDFVNALDAVYTIYKIYPRHLEVLNYDLQREGEADGNYLAISKSAGIAAETL